MGKLSTNLRSFEMLPCYAVESLYHTSIGIGTYPQ